MNDIIQYDRPQAIFYVRLKEILTYRHTYDLVVTNAELSGLYSTFSGDYMVKVEPKGYSLSSKQAT